MLKASVRGGREDNDVPSRSLLGTQLCCGYDVASKPVPAERRHDPFDIILAQADQRRGPAGTIAGRMQGFFATRGWARIHRRHRRMAEHTPCQDKHLVCFEEYQRDVTECSRHAADARLSSDSPALRRAVEASTRHAAGRALPRRPVRGTLRLQGSRVFTGSRDL